MYSDDDIASAVRAGVLTDEVATAFRDHIAGLREAPVVDEERFRLITGFNDIFVVIACLLLLISVSWIGTSVASWFGVLLQAGTAWALAEYFTRKRRMALPSIVLLLTFVAGVLTTGFMLLKNFGLNQELAIGIPSGVAALAAWLHWWRFKVPITVAAGTAALVAGTFMLLFLAIPGARQWVSTITFTAGVVVFVLAMRWDASDTKRQTRRSDVAFWLHIIAAPLLVHPIFSSLQVLDAQSGVWQAVAVAVLYAVIALVSISINRRALMVSALAYVLYTFSALLEQYGVVSLSFAFTAFAIGSGLLLLSAFWHTCREIVLRFYPGFIQERLPPLQ
ncbi:MAG TPA: hypothetical protein ENI80_01225 [Acidiferrobacteraceae bacterium]|nr:hypothetical protein [Acidiferrobacteraceae bacterium]